MPAPYSKDLRWRVIWFVHVLQHSISEASFYLGVSERTVERYISKYLATGDVKAEKLGRSHGTIHFAPREELIIFEAVLNDPDKTLAEIADDIYRQTNSSFALSTIHYYLKRSGVTHKKVRKIALQRNENLRAQYWSNIVLFPPEMLVFLDESGFDKRICRKYGYSFIGTRAEVVRPHQNWGPRISAIPLICTDGLLDVGLYRGHVNEAQFLDFVNNVLAPNLLPFNGINPRSVVIMDNAAIHHTRAVLNAINVTGALVVFLPPYSLDFNPCENIFSQTKSWIATNDRIWRLIDNPERMVMQAFLNVSVQDVINCIVHSNYM